MKYEILNYLPEYVDIQLSPDFPTYISTDSEPTVVKSKILRIKSYDIVSAFMSMQREAIRNAEQERYWIRKNEVIQKIKRMTYFK